MSSTWCARPRRTCSACRSPRAASLGLDPDVARFAREVGLRAVVNGRGARTTALLVATGSVGDRRLRGEAPTCPAGPTRAGSSIATVDGIRFVVVHLSLVRDERAAHLSDVLRDHVPTDADRRARRPERAPRRPDVSAADQRARRRRPDGRPHVPRDRAAAAHRRDPACTPDLASRRRERPVGPAVQAGSDHRRLLVTSRSSRPLEDAAQDRALRRRCADVQRWWRSAGWRPGPEMCGLCVGADVRR